MLLFTFNGSYCGFTAVLAVFLCLVLSCFLSNLTLFAICTSLFYFLWGHYALQPWVSPELTPFSIQKSLSESPIVIEGVISERPSISPDGSRVTVQVERLFSGDRPTPVTGLLLLHVSEGDVTLTRGDRIRFLSRVTVPHRLGLPGEFDYSRYLAYRGVSAIGRVNTQNDIVLIRAAAVETTQRTIDKWARALGDSIRHSIPDERNSSVLTALLIGDQRRIPRDLADAYTRAGVNHILSISGFHIGVIAASISILLLWTLTRCEYLLLHWNVRPLAILIALPIMLFYLQLTGNAPATARSVIMLTVFAAALCVEREHDAINTLLLAAFALVAIYPPTLFDVSFQLSFLSLWGILLVVPVIMKNTATIKSRVVRGLVQFIAVSIAASCVTLLPVLFTFNIASLNGIITNFIIVPLLGYGAVLAGFIALPLIVIFPSLASLLLWPAASLVAISNKFVMWCTSLPVITFYGITKSDISFFLMFMAGMTFLRGRFILLITGVLVPICAIVLHVYAASHSDGQLHITMLSVGQGESMLVTFPDGSNMLVDGGGYLHETGNDFGQRFLAPALGALHVRRIDRMIATHSHPDHSGGLPFVIKNFEVGEFWSGSDVSSDVLNALGKRVIPRRTIAAGDEIALPGQVTITVLSPAKGGQYSTHGDEYSVNEQSLVFRLKYGSFSIIFCADAGFVAEQQMLAGQNKLKSTVIKVGHHGSRYSTSERFIESVHPEIALISVAAENRFGLPSSRIIDLLSSKGIRTYRTDQDRTIELVTDGHTWAVSTPYKPD
ncbi:MAG: DNA internalization-related competence protein ComEC/Rec2 [Desulfuromonadaceae bacterium]|nr:DNA internalization-related competence protein ComEC/Rec2 [Desulfuromonadaceae bacterium]